jgi:hypothetical protein
MAMLLVIAGAGIAFGHGGVVHEPVAVATECVEDTDFMRRNHMALLKHERDETVHEGERGQKYSLRGCLSCHAPAHPADGSTPASIASGEHFCADCHVYTAVKIDCFECHAEIGETVGAR